MASVAALLLLFASTASAAISVTTCTAKPLTVHLNSAPRCTSLRYLLTAQAREVELQIINSSGREVRDVDREVTGLSAGVVDLVYLDPPFNSNATYNVLFQEHDRTRRVRRPRRRRAIGVLDLKVSDKGEL